MNKGPPVSSIISVAHMSAVRYPQPVMPSAIITCPIKGALDGTPNHPMQ
jgi:hypothetical protein